MKGMMEGLYNSVEMEKLVEAAENAEHVWSNASLATLEEMVIKPSSSRGVPPKKEGSRKVNNQQKHVKTSLPPQALRIDIPKLDERIECLQNKALIGKWHFPEMTDCDMRNWLASFWKPILGYIPIISSLMKDWYCFIFQDSADTEAIQNRPWVYKRSFLALYIWYIGFDPLKNTPVNNLIWVKCPNLPLELWSHESLEMIGNAIGRFVYVDPWCLGERDKHIAWILIQRPFRGGYPDHIQISWKNQSINQRLDFWGIPFRCAACRKTGHLVKNCPSAKLFGNRRHIKKSFINGSQSSPISSSVQLHNPGKEKFQQGHQLHTEDLAQELDPVCPGSNGSPLPHMQSDYQRSPFIEPKEDDPIPSPPPMQKEDYAPLSPQSIPKEALFSVGSFPIQISSSSPEIPSLRIHKGKEKNGGPTPLNSPSSSPVNHLDSNLDYLLNNESLNLEPLTIHKPGSNHTPSISPDSARNITVRKKSRGGSRHFRGRTIVSNEGIRNLSLVEIPILEVSEPQPLRASRAAESSK